MKKIFLKDEQVVDYNYLISLFDNDIEEIEKIIEILLLNEYIKPKKNKKKVKSKSDLSYKIVFVGVLYVSKYLLISHPKFINTELIEQRDMSLTIKVLLNYFDNDSVTTEQETEEGNINSFNYALKILQDFETNGLYINERKITTMNNEGTIDWDLTINNINPVLIDNIPFYLEYFINENHRDEFHHISIIHKYIISKISQDYSELIKLLNLRSHILIDTETINLPSETIIIQLLKKQITQEYNTTKINTLNLIIKYLEYGLLEKDKNELIGISTNKFYYVWEYICKSYFYDKLEFKLSELPIKIPDHINAEEKLKDIIEKPIWLINENEYSAPLTYIPDIVYIDDKNLIIYDAKYYVYEFSKKVIYKAPGIESVSKQFFYERIFDEFIILNGLTFQNYFVFPVDEKSNKQAGEVKLKGFEDFKNIKIIELNYQEACIHLLDNH
ncbi:LlaJI family restriction endonuclease [Macrococcoides caseolyticum]|uniref:LlaJI family restriction endonuclease n=1 Tax=Macrococcoides caseolyticum TaxID=69966 RepID=UPI0024BCB305|nr:LlaJI family restriction endonuclease [Macrococcus caseolyticus]MDJ1087922.1 LlaJI family restriction endonuclease [Macrococcus caseolyticus]